MMSLLHHYVGKNPKNDSPRSHWIKLIGIMSRAIIIALRPELEETAEGAGITLIVELGVRPNWRKESFSCSEVNRRFGKVVPNVKLGKSSSLKVLKMLPRSSKLIGQNKIARFWKRLVGAKRFSASRTIAKSELEENCEGVLFRSESSNFNQT